jgi:hypothetical protein
LFDFVFGDCGILTSFFSFFAFVQKEKRESKIGLIVCEFSASCKIKGKDFVLMKWRRRKCKLNIKIKNGPQFYAGGHF